METVHLAVRQLVEFLLQYGSIDSRFTGIDRAAEGSRIHRKLQKAAGEGYAAEVYLKEERCVEGVPYLVDGRADGIFTDEDGLVTIDEIKTTTLPMEQLAQGYNPVHWGQGQVYAAIYAAQQGLERAAVRLTYYQVDEEQTVYRTKVFSRTELEAFFVGLLQQYAPWAKRAARHQQQRRAGLQALGFPFPQYRAGQHAMAGAAYRAFRGGGRLLCQAPTGIGKTMSTLFPALKALGEGYGERIFYLTARTTTRQAAEDALERLRASQPGLCLRSITLTAKEKICPREVKECTPDACPLANGYFDRRRGALWEALDEYSFPRAKVEEWAGQHSLCPFEFGLDLALWCDVITGDYNYLFDPVARLARFFESGRGEHLFLVDEAHNLPDRAREMYSAHLSKSQVFAAKKALGGGRGKLARALNKLNSAFVGYRHACEEQPGHTFFTREAQADFDKLLRRCTPPLEEWLEEHRAESGGEVHGLLLQLYFDLRAYLRTAEGYDEHYVTQVSAYGGEVRVSLLCLDPSAFVDACLALGRGAVLFSATLTPLPYYRDILGSAQAQCAALPSPFPAGNLGLWCAGNISTKYARREQSLDQVAEYLYTLAAGAIGNYMAYFPSYVYLQQVLERFTARWPGVRTWYSKAVWTTRHAPAF